MTRKEALKILKDPDRVGYNVIHANDEETTMYNIKSRMALEMAIKALEEQNSVLDKIRAEFISLYPKNYAGELEFGGLSCEFSLNRVLKVIDKYKTESEVTDG